MRPPPSLRRVSLASFVAFLLPLYPQDPPVVVTIRDPGYQEQGEWLASGLPGHERKPTRFAFKAGASAFFKAPAALRGRYRVSFFKVVHAEQIGDAAVPVDIMGAGKTRKTVLDTSGGASGWVEIGVDAFTGGDLEGVRVARGKQGGYLRTSAVKFEATGDPLTEERLDTPEGGAPAKSTLWIEAEHFAFPGPWRKESDGSVAILKGGNDRIAREWSNAIPALTVVAIPREGLYRLWVRAKDYAANQPGTRYFDVSVDGAPATNHFGTHGQDGYQWQDGGLFTLPRAEITLAAHDTADFYGRFDKLALTSDLSLQPKGSGAVENVVHLMPKVRSLRAPGSDNTEELFRAVRSVPDIPKAEEAAIQAGATRLSFRKVPAGGRTVYLPALADGKTGALLADPRHQAFVFLYSPESNAVFQPKIAHHPQFKQPMQVDLGRGVRITAEARMGDVLNGFPVKEYFYPQEIVSKSAEEVVFRTITERFEARFRFRFEKGHPYATVEVTPKRAGFATIGAFFGTAVAKEACTSMLLPYYYQARRFPGENVLLPSCFATSPLALAETLRDGERFTTSIVGDPAEEEFGWLTWNRSFAGFGIYDEDGRVQPAIYAPVPLTDRAACRPGVPLRLAFSFLAAKEPWGAQYGRDLTEVLGHRDYRRNYLVSLDDTLRNIGKLAMDDAKGGWIPRGKGWVQIENKNSVSHSTLLTMLEWYYLTGDERVYEERVVPTLEYLFSRGTQHFPVDPLDYVKTYVQRISFKGPVFLYGTSTFQGFHRMMRERVPALYHDGLTEDGAERVNNAYNSIPRFSEQLYAWKLTGDRKFLQAAIAGCDAYIASNVDRPQENPRDFMPFVRVTVPPYFWAILDMYEETRDPKYLAAARVAADLLCSVIYAHPLPKGNETYTMRRQEFLDMRQTHAGWYLDHRFRLGYRMPTEGGAASVLDSDFLILSPTEKFLQEPASIHDEVLPAWVVSPAGFTPEQPVTLALFAEMAAPGVRLVDGPLQPVRAACESAYLMRLWGHTGDRKYWDFSRNGALGQGANYAGYGALGMSAIERRPDYPLTGPDISTIYYHHIPVHLGFLTDFLFSSAIARSKGRIDFPSVLQQGYVWFINRMYGHERGVFYGETNVWPTLAEGLFSIDTPVVNHLAAFNDRRFCLFLLNEEETNVHLRLALQGPKLRLENPSGKAVAIADGRPESEVAMDKGVLELNLAAKGVLALKIPGTVAGDPRLGPLAPPMPMGRSSFLRTNDEGLGARIQALMIPHPLRERGSFFINTDLTNGGELALRYSADGVVWETRVVRGFPSEFSLPWPDLGKPLRFKLSREESGSVRMSGVYELRFR